MPVGADPGAATPRTAIRTCVGCRGRGDRSSLMRVIAQRGRFVLDPDRRQPGRGANIHSDAACVRQALRRRVFMRALRLQGPVDDSQLRAWLVELERS